jgi:hypothetical protein
MRRFALMALAVFSVIATLMLSRGITDPGATPAMKEGFDIQAAEKNPWTSLKPNTDPAQFQFAIVSDRTGAHRAGVFSRAVQQINLLQPEFVMSVGDLIEGSRDMETNRKQWAEFNGFVKQLQMPFFYVPGNHDASNVGSSDTWKEAYGKRAYYFAYKNCLFVCINTNDEGTDDPKADASYRSPRVSKPQQDMIAEALAKHPKARHTFLFMHHPIWNHKDLEKNGWLAVEKLLADKQYTAFCGHVHVFHKFIRNGRNLYQLATTGGGSSMRGAEYGEIDQVAWVTMKDKGPVISHIGLHGIYRDDLAPIVTEESGSQPRVNPANLIPTRGVVTMEGKPRSGLLVLFTKVKEKADERPLVGNARTATDGSFEVFGPRGSNGLPAGKYQVSFAPAPSLVSDADAKETAPAVAVPDKFKSPATSPIVVDLKEGAGRFEFKLD